MAGPPEWLRGSHANAQCNPRRRIGVPDFGPMVAGCSSPGAAGSDAALTAAVAGSAETNGLTFPWTYWTRARSMPCWRLSAAVTSRKNPKKSGFSAAIGEILTVSKSETTTSAAPSGSARTRCGRCRRCTSSLLGTLGASLSGFLRTIVEVKVATCEQMTYGEFISALPNPTSFNLIEADELEGQICMELSPLIIYPIIDRLLGGTSQDLFIPQRPMTLIESRLISNVTNRGLEALSEAWAGVKEMAFAIKATESNPSWCRSSRPTRWWWSSALR